MLWLVDNKIYHKATEKQINQSMKCRRAPENVIFFVSNMCLTSFVSNALTKLQNWSQEILQGIFIF